MWVTLNRATGATAAGHSASVVGATGARTGGPEDSGAIGATGAGLQVPEVVGPEGISPPGLLLTITISTRIYDIKGRATALAKKTPLGAMLCGVGSDANIAGVAFEHTGIKHAQESRARPQAQLGLTKTTR